MTIGFAMCGSFCTYSKVFPILEQLAQEHTVIPIFSDAACTVDSRFGTAKEHMTKAKAICGTEPLHTIAQVEPIGPKKLLDIRAEEVAGHSGHRPLHGEYPGEAGPFHCRYPCHHGGKEPSAQWTACADSRIHQRRFGRGGGEHRKATGKETLLFRPLRSG